MERTVVASRKWLVSLLFCSVAIARRLFPWTASTLLGATLLEMASLWHQQQPSSRWSHHTLRLLQYGSRRCAELCFVLLVSQLLFLRSATVPMAVILFLYAMVVWAWRAQYLGRD